MAQPISPAEIAWLAEYIESLEGAVEHEFGPLNKEEVERARSILERLKGNS